MEFFDGEFLFFEIRDERSFRVLCGAGYKFAVRRRWRESLSRVDQRGCRRGIFGGMAQPTPLPLQADERLSSHSYRVNFFGLKPTFMTRPFFDWFDLLFI